MRSYRMQNNCLLIDHDLLALKISANTHDGYVCYNIARKKFELYRYDFVTHKMQPISEDGLKKFNGISSGLIEHCLLENEIHTTVDLVN